jgi:hypothetical protein
MNMHPFISLLVCTLLAAPCQAADFRAGQVEGLFDLTLAYGLGVRLDDVDDDLVAIANGGKAKNANKDDGDLNYQDGIISNALRLNADLTLAWQNFGAYVRGYAFYDYENEHENRDRTPLSADAKDIVGKDADLLDYYVSAHFSLGNIPLFFRLGDQVVNWGDSNFVRDGIDVINPFDLAALNQPAVPARDLRIPQGMLWGAANVTENVAFEAYYQYEWQPAVLPPVGSYFSTNDLLGGDGVNFSMLGAGSFSDLGTNLDTAFGLPAGTLGFDPDFFKIPGGDTRDASNQGQFGVSVSLIPEDTNATSITAYLVRYNSRLPLVSGLTANQQAVAQTTQAKVDVQAASLVPAYESTGLTPAEAAEAASRTSEALTTSEYGNQSRYVVEYPDDITMIGMGFNTATIKRGLLVAGEYAYHIDYPFQVSLTEVFTSVLSPMQFNNAGAGGALGNYGADDYVKGYIRRDRSQATIGITQLFGPRLGAAQTAVNADIAGVHVHDMPSSSKLPLQGVETPTMNSWGYRLAGVLTYQGVLGGLTLEPRIVWTHDVDGVTPAPVSSFLEDRKSLTFALGSRYIDRWTANLSYTKFFGAGNQNFIRDRDIVRLRVSYTF